MSTELIELQIAEHSTLGAPAAPRQGMLHRLFQQLERFPSAWRGVVSLIDQGIVSATSFATAIIINRVCSADEVGLYYLSMTIVLLTLGVHEHVIAAPYTIYSRRYSGADRRAFAGSAWFHHAVLTATAVAILLITIGGLLVTGGAAILPALYALVVAGPLLLTREWIRRFAFADMDFLTALAIDACVAVVQLGGLLTLAYFERLSLFNIYLTMGAACGLASLGWRVARTPATYYDTARFLGDWRRNWSFGRWALRSYLVHNTVPYVMVWVVGAAAGTVSAGLLGACTTLIGVTTLLLTGFDRFLTPRAAQAFVDGGSPALRGVLVRAAALLVVALLPFCLVVFATGPWLAVLAYGEGYEHSGPVLATLAAASMTTALEMVAGIGLWSVDRPRANFLADLCSVSVTILLALLLVTPLGAWGAALATLAGSATAAVARSLTLWCILDTEPRPHPISDEAPSCQ